MRGTAQPGAKPLRDIQPGHRLQGDGGPPTHQGTPGVVDGDAGIRTLLAWPGTRPNGCTWLRGTDSERGVTVSDPQGSDQ